MEDQVLHVYPPETVFHIIIQKSVHFFAFPRGKAVAPNMGFNVSTETHFPFSMLFPQKKKKRKVVAQICPKRLKVPAYPLLDFFSG